MLLVEWIQLKLNTLIRLRDDIDKYQENIKDSEKVHTQKIILKNSTENKILDKTTLKNHLIEKIEKSQDSKVKMLLYKKRFIPHILGKVEPLKNTTRRTGKLRKSRWIFLPELLKAIQSSTI